jgi:hypothetical protein
MKNLFLIFFIVILNFVGTSYTKFCDPVHTPFDQILTRFDPQLNTAVEGYFISENTFKVTYSYSPSIQIGSEQKVFEYGPFGNRCERYEIGINADKTFIGSKNIRLLFLYKDRSKDERLVTPVFHGEGVSIVNHKTVTFYQRIYNEKAQILQYYRFSTALASVRNVLQQKDTTTSVKWKKELLKVD